MIEVKADIVVGQVVFIYDDEMMVLRKSDLPKVMEEMMTAYKDEREVPDFAENGLDAEDAAQAFEDDLYFDSLSQQIAEEKEANDE